jgi:hypothetical protein
VALRLTGLKHIFLHNAYTSTDDLAFAGFQRKIGGRSDRAGQWRKRPIENLPVIRSELHDLTAEELVVRKAGALGQVGLSGKQRWPVVVFCRLLGQLAAD